MIDALHDDCEWLERVILGRLNGVLLRVFDKHEDREALGREIIHAIGIRAAVQDEVRLPTSNPFVSDWPSEQLRQVAGRKILDNSLIHVDESNEYRRHAYAQDQGGKYVVRQTFAVPYIHLNGGFGG
jgi:hypothetical protein